MPFGVFQKGRTPAARIVAGDRPLDLDDIGAEVAQQLSGPGAGQNAGEVENTDVRERAGHGLR